MLAPFLFQRAVDNFSSRILQNWVRRMVKNRFLKKNSQNLFRVQKTFQKETMNTKRGQNGVTLKCATGLPSPCRVGRYNFQTKHFRTILDSADRSAARCGQIRYEKTQWARLKLYELKTFSNKFCRIGTTLNIQKIYTFTYL